MYINMNIYKCNNENTWFVKTDYKLTACFLCAAFRARPRKTSTHAIILINQTTQVPI